MSGCGRKADPTLDDYLPPQPVKSFQLSATYEKVIISWSYPEKEMAKVESFLIERESSEGIKTLGYFSKDLNSLEDRDFAFEQTYKYRIFAISPKGIFSTPTEAIITPKKLPEVENIAFKITNEGVMLTWNTQGSFGYNIYRMNNKGELTKIGSTDKNYFSDNLLYSIITKNTGVNNDSLVYLVSTYLSEQNSYIEGKKSQITVPLEQFIPSKPDEIFWSINELGVSISWKEVPEKWVKGYRVYRKRANEQNFNFVGETLIPLFVDGEFNLGNIKEPIYYRISTIGPSKESESVEIKVEVIDG
ncbi:hypothetical protein [Thermodesulfovibrio hydrogeniphilus]